MEHSNSRWCEYYSCPILAALTFIGFDQRLQLSGVAAAWEGQTNCDLHDSSPILGKEAQGLAPNARIKDQTSSYPAEAVPLPSEHFGVYRFAASDRAWLPVAHRFRQSKGLR